MSDLRESFLNHRIFLNNMNLARNSRQLFPLILGNSRTAFAAAQSKSIAMSVTKFSKEELDIKLDKNPYYEKYAEKIKKLKETNPEEYRKKLDAIKKLSSKPSWSENKTNDTKQRTSESADSSSVDPKRKGLDAIMKLELLEYKSASEITELWKNYYKDRDAVFAVIQSNTYQTLHSRRQENPVFIYPLPRKDGYEMFLGQVTGNDCHFTTLIQYQKYGENAPAQLVINHYTEFKESKGIVLMSGVPMNEGISITDAQLLSYQMQYFYNEDNYQIVKDFNKSPNSFDYNRIIECVSGSLLAQQNKSRNK
uniref:ATP synthase mitochondrial F1 complex assembly factor 1-like isoform X1 n=2 Tax=Styela clava TaxID=7725 RepID=UPI00193A6808|nr:ATP synthase mitochondrial F1 complex assembly factor 1-like isoform X1 [Styela clava]